ncbi:MAG: bifunctional folylpolyglutamate synthase/dihydrofolate synthase, partial [Microcystaceae cyanobacterium]
MLQKIDTLLDYYRHFGVRLGLERVELLLAYLNNPQNQTPFIHVAGTNGKGSTCAYLASVLTAAGYKVGRYTSPHLVHWTERICINNNPISEAKLIEILELIQSYTDKIIEDGEDCPTQFEVLTAAAWLYFQQEKVDIAVIEVGLGGRLDSTNVCQPPLVSIITSISFDHVRILGPTLADIAREKAGILKQDCPAVIGEIPTEALAPIQEKLTQLNCPAIWIKPAIGVEKSGKFWAIYDGIEYPLSLTGQVQLLNSALAIAALLELQKQGWKIPLTAIQEGMGNAVWPGRLQWTNWQQKPLLLDGAHNPAGAAYLRGYADSLNKPILWILGMLGNKNYQEILQLLLKPNDALYLVPVPDHL